MLMKSIAEIKVKSFEATMEDYKRMAEYDSYKNSLRRDFSVLDFAKYFMPVK